jgi:hypothetical protein
MASKRNIERGLAVQDYGRNCYCCAKGPLSGRGLFLVPIGHPEFVNTARRLAPVCASCRTALEKVTPIRHIENLRRDARKALAATQRWFDEYGPLSLDD